MLLRHAIGIVLRRRRAETGKTLRQLAEDSSVSLPYLSEIERGRKETSSEILATVCRVLNLSPADFLEDVRAEYLMAPVIELHPAALPDRADGGSTMADDRAVGLSPMRPVDGLLLAA